MYLVFILIFLKTHSESLMSCQRIMECLLIENTSFFPAMLPCTIGAGSESTRACHAENTEDRTSQHKNTCLNVKVRASVKHLRFLEQKRPHAVQYDHTHLLIKFE
uniref:Secreted protein n=1 Tax=Salix viminalis TaxID=40686 RepID=A0A6N2L101_SALVM